MHILFCASEMGPFARTGGLGDVIGALPRALSRADPGMRITVALPYYGSVEAHGHRFERHGDEIPVELGTAGRLTFDLRRLTLSERLEVAALGCPELFGRPGLYGDAGGDFPDNDRRFIAFCKAVHALACRLDPPPDLLHCHDWHAGLVPWLARRSGPRPFPSLFTIHNLGYQGIFGPESMDLLGPEARADFTPDGLWYHDRLSLLKAGIVYAGRVSTVSPTYAAEIVTDEYGFGMQPWLRQRGSDLSGILNGVDYAEWNPAADPHLPAGYTVDDISGKQACRRELRSIFRLDDRSDAPVVAMITRLARQKGIELVVPAVPAIVASGAHFVMLGSGERDFEQAFERLARELPGRVGTAIAFSDRLAHLVEAGSDIFLMPSRYEPCGLNQIYSQAYGTVPVVRATGGLADTVVDPATDPERATGFRFSDYSSAAMLDALGRALAAFRDPAGWLRMQNNGMRADFSWDASARGYLELYREAVADGSR